MSKIGWLQYLKEHTDMDVNGVEDIINENNSKEAAVISAAFNDSLPTKEVAILNIKEIGIVNCGLTM